MYCAIGDIQDTNKFACGNCGKPIFPGDSSDGQSMKELTTAISDVQHRKEVLEKRVKLVISNPA
jgi:hypothetical protein